MGDVPDIPIGGHSSKPDCCRNDLKSVSVGDLSTPVRGRVDALTYEMGKRVSPPHARDVFQQVSDGKGMSTNQT